MTISDTYGTIKLDNIISRMEEATVALRFVDRRVNFGGTPRPMRILQQRWDITERESGIVMRTHEWRDVPLELEE